MKPLSWLFPAALAELERARDAGAPCALAHAVDVRDAAFDRARLLDILHCDGLDALVIREGATLDRALPQRASELEALLDDQAGLVIRRAERADPRIAQLAGDLAAHFAVELHAQLFVTPARAQGFGWHYDAEDVLILQTCGSKTYYLRSNTLEPDLRRGAQPDFQRVREETSPLMKCSLHAGGCLYLPRGMWHAARAVEESYSVSLGLAART